MGLAIDVNVFSKTSGNVISDNIALIEREKNE